MIIIVCVANIANYSIEWIRQLRTESWNKRIIIRIFEQNSIFIVSNWNYICFWIVNFATFWASSWFAGFSRYFEIFFTARAYVIRTVAKFWTHFKLCINRLDENLKRFPFSINIISTYLRLNCELLTVEFRSIWWNQRLIASLSLRIQSQKLFSLSNANKSNAYFRCQ